MGRPINKRFLGDVAGRIQVTSYRRSGGSETAGGDDTYIVRQRSTNKFLVADTSGGWQEVLTLVDKAEGALDEGEFMIEALEADGSPSRAIRLYNRTLRLTGPKKQKWSLGAAVEQAISAVTLGSGVVVDITVADTSDLATGDQVTISEVGGAVELNGNTYTITVVDATSITLDGTDGDNFTAYTSGGLVRKVGDANDGATIDVQAS